MELPSADEHLRLTKFLKLFLLVFNFPFTPRPSHIYPRFTCAFSIPISTCDDTVGLTSAAAQLAIEWPAALSVDLCLRCFLNLFASTRPPSLAP